MKSLNILFAGKCGSFGFENTFGGKNALYRTLEWAKKLENGSKTVIFCFSSEVESVKNTAVEAEKDFGLKIEVSDKGEWTNEVLFSEIKNSLSKDGADSALFSMAFCPFLNADLTKKLIATHTEYKSEYSFADGFPYGVSPEIIDAGLSGILSELIKTKDELKDKPVTKDSVMDLLKTDINSFEIETEISEIDWRLYRFDFECDKKENYLACKNLYELSQKMSDDERKDVQKIISKAVNEKVLKTIPAYFNIQIEKSCPSKCTYCAYSEFEKNMCGQMEFEKYAELLKNINSVNPDCVVSLSLWGEPLLHKDFFKFVEEGFKYEGITVLIETTGFDFSKLDVNNPESDFAKNMKSLSEKFHETKILKNGLSKLIWIVSLDAMKGETYEKLHPGLKYENAVESVKYLNSLFDGAVYAQYLRLNENEDELESFFRTFKEKTSISGGNFIIQKYDNFCKKLEDHKSADLSPVERFPCWHLRRDFNILSNGDVPLCKNKSFDSPLGNVFTDSIESIWNKFDSELKKHIEKNYCNGCEVCDEFYTYNF
ncbi:MAG: spiro-SPASM protein [Treponema sp.]|nr:spiro-SPASM protein [Candidatus Treponema merdequi]